MNSRAKRTVFLKLGGSLITDKEDEKKARIDVISRLAQEIALALKEDTSLQLLVGHGSGSFGHVVGKKYGTREGVHTPEQWYGFAETADAAALLNRIVVGALLEAGVPAWNIQPSATLRSHNGRIVAGPEETIALAMEKGLVPIVHGDVCLDVAKGGTIASTEEIFEWLLPYFRPQKMVLSGQVEGIYSTDPNHDSDAQLLHQLRPEILVEVERGLGGSHGIDVTGGMLAKVKQSLRMVEEFPHMEIIVCSGMKPGLVQEALRGNSAVLGTRIAV